MQPKTTTADRQVVFTAEEQAAQEAANKAAKKPTEILGIEVPVGTRLECVRLSFPDRPPAPKSANPVCAAWRLASEEERDDFAAIFGDDVRRYQHDHVPSDQGDVDICGGAR
jgi:hypothetical protein